MDAQKAYNRLFDIFPNATIDTDNDGQVIVYTDMKEGKRDPKTNAPLTLEPFESE